MPDDVKPATDELIRAFVDCAKINYDNGVYSAAKYREVLAIKARLDAAEAGAMVAINELVEERDTALARVAELERLIAEQEWSGARQGTSACTCEHYCCPECEVLCDGDHKAGCKWGEIAAKHYATAAAARALGGKPCQ
jgi:hypothetical protein